MSSNTNLIALPPIQNSRFYSFFCDTPNLVSMGLIGVTPSVKWLQLFNLFRQLDKSELTTQSESLSLPYNGELVPCRLFQVTTQLQHSQP